MHEYGSLGRTLSLRIVAALVVGCLLAVGGWVFAQDKPAAPVAPAPTAEAKPADAKAPADPMKELTTKVGDTKVALDTVWVVITAFLGWASS